MRNYGHFHNTKLRAGFFYRDIKWLFDISCDEIAFRRCRGGRNSAKTAPAGYFSGILPLVADQLAMSFA
jgi:hypothetical protein